MNVHAKLLDCTLRDGAYLIEKNFGNKNIHGIVDGLVKAGIDFVEIGFLQNEGFGEGKTVFKNSADVRPYIPQQRNRTKFTVLADYSRYNISNLDAYTGNSFDAVRACFFKKERFDVIPFCKRIKELGYMLFVQPVDIMGYTDSEIIELIEMINEINPYCFSIVDTFGSMYESDLQRVYSLVHHNLRADVHMGFHSHNNLQMSSALSQAFLKISYGQRQAIVDATLSGMGRGAGNTPTELIAEYMVSRLGYDYQMDELLDLMDGYIDNLRARCTWGYSLPYFIAGAFSAHVNNIAYLSQKNSIQAKDMRYILDKIGPEVRKRYDYDLLEKEYLDYIHAFIDDADSVDFLKDHIGKKSVLIIAPGGTIEQERKKINTYIEKERPVVIATNFISKEYPTDYLFFSNMKRFNAWKHEKRFLEQAKIITSNIHYQCDDAVTVSFVRLAKYTNSYADNSIILLLRLLDILDVRKIAIAGFDGYATGNVQNYADAEMEISSRKALNKNRDIGNLLKEYFRERKSPIPVHLLTQSVFQSIIKDVQ